MKTFSTKSYKSDSAKKAEEEKLNVNRSAKYHVFLRDSSKPAISIETQLKRFKSTIKK